MSVHDASAEASQGTGGTESDPKSRVEGSGAVDAVSMQLSPCAYRVFAGSRMQCEAEELAEIKASDCRRCTIPEALRHPKACLYLLPVRVHHDATFVCRAYSSKVHALSAKDWRDFGFRAATRQPTTSKAFPGLPPHGNATVSS